VGINKKKLGNGIKHELYYMIELALLANIGQMHKWRSACRKADWEKENNSTQLGDWMIFVR
jgi:hypothetical protein